MKKTPKPYQEDAIQKILNEPTKSALIASDTGAGKTLIATEVAMRSGYDTVLIIGPLNTRRDDKGGGWENSFKLQGDTRPFLEITSKTKENFTRLRNGEPGIYFVGREYFTLSGTDSKPRKDDQGVLQPPKRKALWDWGLAKPGVVIFDEVHAASNMHSSTFKVLKQLRFAPGYKISMSATPAGNRFQGMYSVCKWMWWDLIPRSFHRWATQWCATEYDPWARSGVKYTHEKEPGAFVKTLPCYIRDTPPKKEYEEIKVQCDMLPAQREMYEQMEMKSFVWLKENPLVADLPVVQRVRLRQIALAEVTINEDDEVDFPLDAQSTKIQAIEKIIAKHPGEAILFWTHSQKFAKLLAHRIGGEEYSGAIPRKKRDELLAKFGTEVKYLCATIDGVGPGTDGLQKDCHIEVWCSESDNRVSNTQALGRLNRHGQKADKIIQYRLLSPDTLDVGVYSKLVQDELKMRRSLQDA